MRVPRFQELDGTWTTLVAFESAKQEAETLAAQVATEPACVLPILGGEALRAAERAEFAEATWRALKWLTER